MAGVDLGIEDFAPGRLIGAGGTSAVYAARRSDGSLVAIKVLRASLASEDAKRSFDRERQAVGRISQHPNIVEILDAGLTDRGEPYLVMPLMNGSLQDVLDRDGPMPWDQAVAIMAKVSDAIAHAHSHEVLHRDIKPANILIDPAGEPLVADFGVAKMVDHATLNTMNHALTPHYAPPERLRGEAATVSGDVYGLAATLYALIVGQSPVGSAHELSAEATMHRLLNDEPPKLDQSQAPEPIARIVGRGLTKSSAARPIGAAAFGNALRNALDTDGEEALDGSSGEPGWVSAPMVNIGLGADHGDMIEPDVAISSPSPEVGPTAQRPSQRFVDRLLTPQSWWLVAGGIALFVALFLPWVTTEEDFNAFEPELPWALTGYTLDPAFSVLSAEEIVFLFAGLDPFEGSNSFAHGWVLAVMAISTVTLAYSARNGRLVAVLTAVLGSASIGLVVVNYLAFSEQLGILKDIFGSLTSSTGRIGPGMYLAGLASVAIVIGSVASLRKQKIEV